MTPSRDTHEALSLDDLARLSAHIAGEGTSVQRAATEAWITVSPVRLDAARRVRIVWRVGDTQPVGATEAAWDTLRGVIQQPHAHTPVRFPRVNGQRNHRHQRVMLGYTFRWMAVAAGVLLCAWGIKTRSSTSQP